MHVSGVQTGGAPHWLGVPPPPHVLLPEQVPQVMVPPQPSPSVPQLAFA
jgi:hypothetical protein